MGRRGEARRGGRRKCERLRPRVEACEQQQHHHHHQHHHQQQQQQQCRAQGHGEPAASSSAGGDSAGPAGGGRGGMAVSGGRRPGMEGGWRRGRGWGVLAWPVTLVVVTAMLCLTAATAANKRRKTALIEGDILIGALFSVHELPKQKTASTLTCGDIREQYGIQRVEAAFLAIDQINKNTELLPNIRLGVEIRDSCWYSSIALQQSLEFIRDALSAPWDATNTSTRTDSCKVASPKKHLVGVVGPGSSDVTIQVQNLLQLFSIPQVGYSATSKDLSIKSHYSYFMRVVPSDYYQAQVLVDIVRYYNWTYVSTVYTIGNYGQSGMSAFKKLAEENNVCPAKEESVRSDADEEAYDSVIRSLMEDQRAKVVVCFCEGMTITNLLKAVKRNTSPSRFLFIGSDGWADRSDVVSAGLESVAEGGLTVKIQSPHVHEFDDYYFSLHPDTNTRNPWFKEFWQHRFNCSLSDGEEGGEKLCTKNESLAENYKQDTKMAFVMKAIYTMAWGLHNMQRALCKPGEGTVQGHAAHQRFHLQGLPHERHLSPTTTRLSPSTQAGTLLAGTTS
ncbi:hypothetical protein O3P69_009385 [Scylla paramamosain]|uniref:Receptor ligand binding region domain-containing protein n=1 Tax=Scylla paramamosain TaxID=85552 RepID=A0AAW0STT0_SCYPA